MTAFRAANDNRAAYRRARARIMAALEQRDEPPIDEPAAALRRIIDKGLAALDASERRTRLRLAR